MVRRTHAAVRHARGLAVTLLGACTATPGDSEGRARTVTDDALTARVEAITAPLVDAHLPSGAIVFSRDGATVFARGYGLANHAAGLAFTPDTPADGGSLAKTFTAAALQALAHEGRVDLDAPVTRFVPTYPHAATTVRHLVVHSDGLPPYHEFFDPYFGPTDIRTTEALLDVVRAQRPQPSFPPGTRFEYSNLGWDVAALIIERLTGQSYEAVLRERFLAPFAMKRTFARPARLADWSGTRTLGYRWVDSAWQVVDVFDNEAFLGASNLYFSAHDLARWANAWALGEALPAAVVNR